MAEHESSRSSTSFSKHDIAVELEERLTTNSVFAKREGDGILSRVVARVFAILDVERRAGERSSYPVLSVAGGQHDTRYAVLCEQSNASRENRLAADIDERFGPIIGEGTQARADTRNQDHRKTGGTHGGDDCIRARALLLSAPCRSSACTDTSDPRRTS